jgi:anaerobic selenocysteine-containing dehydrogenase
VLKREELKLVYLKWSAGVPVAMIATKTAEQMGIHENDRVSIEKPSSVDCRVFLTVVNIVEDMIKEGDRYFFRSKRIISPKRQTAS